LKPRTIVKRNIHAFTKRLIAIAGGERPKRVEGNESPLSDTKTTIINRYRSNVENNEAREIRQTTTINIAYTYEYSGAVDTDDLDDVL
jgi:hypothetical protein